MYSILSIVHNPWRGNGYPLQYSFLENLTDRGGCWATVLIVHLQLVKRVNLKCSVRFSHSAVSDSLWPRGLQHARLPVHRQLPEIAQTHVHCISDAIQPSHPLSSPSLPAFNLSQHQGLFPWVSSSHQVAKVLEFQLQHQFLQWIFRTDFL